MRKILSFLIYEDILAIAACISLVATGFWALDTRFDVIPSIALFVSGIWFNYESNRE